MSDVKKICLADLKNKYKKGLLIPEIQRDYVMGAGGKLKNSDSDKLTRLLDAILRSFEQKKEFDFSCIITFCRDVENNRLEIYDGQQRLTTLILLVLFCLHREGKEDYKDYKNWYEFCKRPIANEIFGRLTEDEFRIEDIRVRDFSSFSMKNLLTTFSAEKYKEITSDFLLDKVKFDCVEIGSQNEIEQFFMDLNSGVKLKDYELYKAKLVHYIRQEADKAAEEDRTILQMWPHRLDNEWLNIFMPFADFKHPAEEYEMAFIRYCFRMLSKCHEAEKINSVILKDCFHIMNSMSKVLFTKPSDRKPQVVEFAWGTVYECHRIERAKSRYNDDKRGAYWNLKYHKNTEHMSYIIKNVLLDDKVNPQMENDLIVWAWITTLDWQIDYQDEYIRMLKIMLNHICMKNTKAWYECQDKGQYLFYSKYCVMNIPSYYGKHLESADTDDSKEKEYECVYDLVKNFRENKRFRSRIINRQEVSKSIMDEIQKVYRGDTSIIETRRKRLETYETYEEFCKMESECNGILHNVRKDDYYLAKVDLSWPTRCKTDPVYENCFVLLKCDMDKFYDSCYGVCQEENNELVKAYAEKYDKPFDIERCFWTGEHKAYIIKDRATDSSKTYESKKEGESDKVWANIFPAPETDTLLT